jgi:bacterioferritin (cytochrome b1)
MDMKNIKKELAGLMNSAFKREHAAVLQYLEQADQIKEVNPDRLERLVQRLNEIAMDEQRHARQFRELISYYLDSEPTKDIAEMPPAIKNEEIFAANVRHKKETIDLYKQIYDKVCENQDQLQFEYKTFENVISKVIFEEQEHVTELSLYKHGQELGVINVFAEKASVN